MSAKADRITDEFLEHLEELAGYNGLALKMPVRKEQLKPSHAAIRHVRILLGEKPDRAYQRILYYKVSTLGRNDAFWGARKQILDDLEDIDRPWAFVLLAGSAVEGYFLPGEQVPKLKHEWSFSKGKRQAPKVRTLLKFEDERFVACELPQDDTRKYRDPTGEYKINRIPRPHLFRFKDLSGLAAKLDLEAPEHSHG